VEFARRVGARPRSFDSFGWLGGGLMMLLSRVADRIFWAARYLERAEDTSRIVRAHTEMLADLPTQSPAMWKPLIAVVGSTERFGVQFGEDVTENGVVSFLLSEHENSGSVVSCVGIARENLRTTRETIPRDGWQALNDLYHYVNGEVDRGVDRRARERFLGRVIADSRRIDGILATTMNHDEAYAMWRLGRALERADMTTRVLGVRAAAVLSEAEVARSEAAEGAPPARRHDELQWMGVLRSLSGLQMYSRSVRGPIEGPAVVRFLLEHDRFPRAVRALLREIRRALADLPDPARLLDEVDRVDAVLRDSTADGVDGKELDDAMDQLQVAMGSLDRLIHDHYLRLGS